MHRLIKHPVLALCPKCSKVVRPHTVCLNCGFYKGREVINVLEKLSKKDRKKREKEIAGKEAEKPLSAEELSKK